MTKIPGWSKIGEGMWESDSLPGLQIHSDNYDIIKGKKYYSVEKLIKGKSSQFIKKFTSLTKSDAYAIKWMKAHPNP